MKRFVYVSSLGAERGRSAYHASKLKSEALAEAFPGEWLICRPGNVYGPGDEVVSFLLQLVRSSPAAPVIDAGDQPFQPIYAEDLGAALALAVTRRELDHQVLLLAGPETTTTHDLLDRLARLTGRNPVRIPVPAALASLGAQAASLLGVKLPVDDNKLGMLLEENVIRPGEVNALTEVLGIQPTPLDEGLRRLATSQPEQIAAEGTGPLTRRIYHARLTGVQRSPSDLFAEFRRRFFELVPESTMGDAGEPGEPSPAGDGRNADARPAVPRQRAGADRRDRRRRDDLRDRRRPPARRLGGLPFRGGSRQRPPLRGRDLRPPGDRAGRPRDAPLRLRPQALELDDGRPQHRREPRARSRRSRCRRTSFPCSESEEREAMAALRQKVSKLAREEEPGLRQEAKGRVEEAFKPA